ncbi:MAG: 2-oxo-4-hydroxy-4-carboxy-5-ureidoimidazoline decarboxylase [Vicinamibacteria bacterium]
MDALAWLNHAPSAEAEAALFRCCGCAGWARDVAAARPFHEAGDLMAAAEREWAKASREDILEAFSHHPRIGDQQSLKVRFPLTHGWSSEEQTAVSAASESVLGELAKANRDYEARFGYIFIVCASGKTASEMLELLGARLSNEHSVELKVAAGEQMKITRLRLEKLLGEPHQRGNPE